MSIRTGFLIVCLAASTGTWMTASDDTLSDPYGLGERLVLIDWLHAHPEVRVPDEASVETLRALYVQVRESRENDADRQNKQREHEQAADRARRLRQQLAERFHIQASAEADEADLSRQWRQAESDAHDAALRSAQAQAQAQDNSAINDQATGERDAAGVLDRDAARTLLRSVIEDLRQTVAEVESLARRHQRMALAIVQADERLHLQDGVVEQLQTRYQHALNQYEQAQSTVAVSAELLLYRDRLEEIRDEQTAAESSLKELRETRDTLVVDDQESEQRRLRGMQRAEILAHQQAELNQRIAK